MSAKTAFGKPEKPSASACTPASHLLTLHAISLNETLSRTAGKPRTDSFPIPCARFNSENVASTPPRIE